MRVAFIVEKFPNISETFILDEIIGVLARDVEVDIYAFRRGTRADIHPGYVAHELAQRTTYCVPAERGRFERSTAAIGPTLRMLGRNPAAFVRSALTRNAAIQTRTFVSLARAFVNARSSYDVVHAHFGPSGIRADAIRRAGAFRAPLVTTFHGYDATSFAREHGAAVYANVARAGERFIAVSQSIARELAALGFPAARTTIMPLGVDCRIAPPPPARTDGQNVRVVSIGRFVEKKGFVYAIRAVAQAHARYPHLRYEIIGDGDLRPSLEAAVTELDAAGFVSFLGYKNQAEIVELLATADIMLAASVTAADGDSESMPIVIKEAMAAGLPVVASRHAGIPEIVVDGETGLLADERDSAQLARHLERLAGDPPLRRRLGAAGRAVIESSYDNERLIDELVELYRELAGSARA